MLRFHFYFKMTIPDTAQRLRKDERGDVVLDQMRPHACPAQVPWNGVVKAVPKASGSVGPRAGREGGNLVRKVYEVLLLTHEVGAEGDGELPVCLLNVQCVGVDSGGAWPQWFMFPGLRKQVTVPDLTELRN